jgi:hypothetical protein
MLVGILFAVICGLMCVFVFHEILKRDMRSGEIKRKKFIYLFKIIFYLLMVCIGVAERNVILLIILTIVGLGCFISWKINEPLNKKR